MPYGHRQVPCLQIVLYADSTLLKQRPCRFLQMGSVRQLLPTKRPLLLVPDVPPILLVTRLFVIPTKDRLKSGTSSLWGMLKTEWRSISCQDSVQPPCAKFIPWNCQDCRPSSPRQSLCCLPRNVLCSASIGPPLSKTRS